MKALITGGNGFIGSFLIESLLEKGYEIRCLVRKTSNLRWVSHLPINFIYGDVNTPESLVPAVTDCDFIFHLGGVTRARDDAGYFKVNATGTENLLNACIRHAPNLKKFILVSSLAAAGPSPDLRPLTETRPSAPISPYGRSKAAAEKITLSFQDQIPVTILRPPPVYGPRDRDVFEIFRYIKWGIKPRIAGFQRLTSFIYVQDLVDGMLLAAKKTEAAGQIYFLCNDSYYTWEEIANAIEMALGKRAFSLSLPVAGMRLLAVVNEFLTRFANRPALLNRDKVQEMEQRAWICDNRKAKAELGFQPQFSLEQGCRITAQWYQNQGWL